MLLGLDLGTTNVKALVTDHAGRPLAHGASPVPLYRLSNGGVEQEIEEIWKATLAAIRQALAQVDATGIEALGVSSQGGAMQVMDPTGAPLGRVISWLDQRCQPYDQALNAELGRDWFLQRIRHGGSWLSVGQLERLRHEQPGWLRPPNRVGYVGDIIVSRLCGRPAHDGTSAALTLLYNPLQRVYDPDLLMRLGLNVRQLPEILPARATAGGLLPEVAREAGLRAGIPVSPAIHDQYASALSTGAVHAGTVMVGTGTAWVLLAVGDVAPMPATPDALVSHHVIDGLWGQILSMVNGGSAVTWALETLGLAKLDREGIDQLLEASTPGANGLLFWPFLTPYGGCGLAPGTRGRLSGLQLSHRGHDVVRAVVEGLAFELNRHLDFLRRHGQAIQHLVLGGGAGASRVTPQIIADVTGLPLRCFAGSEASLVGATILARGLLEPAVPLATLAEAMLAESREIRPGAGVPLYQGRYREYLASLPLASPSQP